MASYNTTVKVARMQVVIDAIDAGAGPGKLKIYTAGMALLLSTVILADPSWTNNGDGSITLNGVPLTDLDAAATGTPAVATITDSNDAVVISNLSVGTSGTNIIITSNHIDQHDEVRVDSGSIVHAA